MSKFLVCNKMDVAASKVAAVYFKTPVGKVITLTKALFTFTAGPIIASILEDYSFAGGSTHAPQAMNRAYPHSSRMSISKVSADVTAVAGAAVQTLGVNTFPTPTSEKQSVIDGPITLKPDTNYLITFTNSNAGTSTVSYEAHLEE